MIDRTWVVVQRRRRRTTTCCRARSWISLVLMCKPLSKDASLPPSPRRSQWLRRPFLQVRHQLLEVVAVANRFEGVAAKRVGAAEAHPRGLVEEGHGLLQGIRWRPFRVGFHSRNGRVAARQLKGLGTAKGWSCRRQWPASSRRRPRLCLPSPVAPGRIAGSRQRGPPRAANNRASA